VLASQINQSCGFRRIFCCGGTYVGLINNATEGVFKLILAYIDYVAATVEQ